MFFAINQGRRALFTFGIESIQLSAYIVGFAPKPE